MSYDSLTLQPSQDLEIILTDGLGLELRLCQGQGAATISFDRSISDFDVDLLPALRGPIGPAGPAGPASGLKFSAVAGVSMPAGTPVYISLADNKLYPASNSLPLTSKVVGLLLADVTHGFIAEYDRARLELQDWAAITGSQYLVPGQFYFLGGLGNLVVTPPSSGTSTRIGEALSPTQFGVFPTIIPILL